jgi:outer membrane protein OmpA-like peptidoglycan-associated protein
MRIHGVTMPALALAACVAGIPAQAASRDGADSSSPQADIGAFTGLAIGAAAAGPVGAVLGAAAGVVLGDRYHRQKEASRALASELGRSEAERSRLGASVTQLNGSLAQANESLVRANESLAQSQAHSARLEQTLATLDEVGMDVSFRTNDASIKAEDVPPLLKLGALAATMPRLTVRVAGFADPRGPDAYNEALSLRRAQAVAAALGDAGLPAARLIIEAHGSGESTSADGDLDAYALDRRVTVRLERGPPAPLASQAMARAAEPRPRAAGP